MARRADLAQRLADVPLFASCSKRDLAIVARHMEVADLPDETVLCVEGAPGDAFFVLLEGSVAIHRSGRRVALLGAGEHFGELALLDPGPRSATVVADGDVVVGLLGARVFRGIVRDVPDLTEKLLRAMAQRLRAADLAPND
jgi:CRP/FNR family cyclic AMP-dependent transcriptional regulator